MKITSFERAKRLSIRRTQLHGAALIATLALVLLLTFVLVAFLTRATSNRQIETAEAGSQKADLLARSALQVITRDLRQEMLAGSTNYTAYYANSGSYNNNGTYANNAVGASILWPVTKATAGPCLALSPGVSAFTNTPAGTNFYSLIKQSGASPIFPTTAPYTNNNATAMIIGSAITTDTVSANGHLVSGARWNAPYLTANGFTASNQLPTWVLLTRAGIASSQAWNPQFSNSTQSNTNYVVGRFAYNIYDESGLLDINAAGYPSSLSQAQIASLKGTLMGADLSQIPGIADPNSLVQWRNAASASSASSFTNAAAWQITNGAFLVPFTGDNQYLSRQDLIRYAQANPSVISTNALQYLTTFTREVNAPSWGPDRDASAMGGINVITLANAPSSRVGANGNQNNTTWNYAYADNANTVRQYNRIIPNVRFPQAASVTDYKTSGANYTYNVNAGDPLVQHRFSLDKLSWIGPNGPVKPANCPLTDSQFADAVQACFGLVWDSTNKVWDYVGPKGAYPGNNSGIIETLDDVGNGNLIYPWNSGNVYLADTTPRAPNFFELLKSGILAGSLGLWPNNNDNTADWNSTGYVTFNACPDIQVMRIGANLIDQCSNATNAPTCIIFNSLPVVGSKSLPLINKLVFTSEVHQIDSSHTLDGTASVWLEFEMWNPYADAATANTAIPSSRQFQIVLGGDGTPKAPTVLNGSGQVALAYSTNTAANNYVGGNLYYNPPYPVAGQALQVNIPSTTNMDEPTMIAQLGASNCKSVNNPYPQTPGYFENDIWPGDSYNPGPIVGFNIGYFDGTFNKTTQDCYLIDEPQKYLSCFQTLNNIGSKISALDVNYYLQYNYGTASAADWRTVQCLHDVLLENGTYFPISNSYDGTIRQGALATVDPRTDRFGSTTLNQGNVNRLAMGSSPSQKFWGTSICADPTASGQNSQFLGVQMLINDDAALSYGLFLPLNETPPVSYASWRFADNAGLGTHSFTYISDPSYLDLDRAQRPGDGVWTGDSSGVYPLATAFPNARIGTGGCATDRPVILNRPFQSVGEMSYAFRDTPWRSLDFSSTNSPDSALMDLFCVGDDSQSLRAGRINPNRASQATLAALMSGANQDVLNGTYVSAANAQTAATAISSVLQTSPATTKAQLLENVSTNSLNAISPIKSQRDAVVRSLAEVSQTRTWNLMIDVVAQSGRYTSAATAADQFTVDGERRYWLHLAIDRYTGKVVDEQLEQVNE